VKSLADAFAEKFGYPVRQVGPEVIFECPKCCHRSLSCNITNGLYKCWCCGFSRKDGGTIEGAPGEYREIPVDRELQQQLVRYCVENFRLSDSHRDHLKERGIYRPELYKISTIPFDAVAQLVQAFPSADLEASGMLVRDFSTSKLRPGLTLEPRRILIPYWHGDEYVSFKARSNPFEFQEKDNWKYASPRGSRVGSHLFYRNDFQSTDLLVTEGELKALAALEAGVSTVAIPGIEFTSSVVIQLTSLIVRTQAQRVFIALDNEPDLADHYPVLRSMVRLSSIIGSRACILVLPKKSPGQKMDLDLFLSQHNSSDLEDVMEDSWHKRKLTLNWVQRRVAQLQKRN
jgi:hypothetical protein